VITYRTDFIKDVPQLWGLMAQTQSRMSNAEFIAKLRAAATTPLWATSAWDGLRCVGVMMFWKAANKPEATRLLKQLELNPAQYIIRANIYVHSDFQGQKISRHLYAEQNAYALKQGIVGAIGYGYETKEIVSWAEALPGITVTDLKDSNGYPVVISNFST